MNSNPPSTPSRNRSLNPLTATYSTRSNLKATNTLHDMQSEERRKAVEIIKINAELQEARSSMETYKKQFHIMSHDINKRNDVIRQMMVDKELLAKQYHEAVEHRKYLEMTSRKINKERMAHRRDLTQMETRCVEQARIHDRIINEKQQVDARCQELESYAIHSQTEYIEKLKTAQQEVDGLQKRNEDQEIKLKKFQQEKAILIDQWTNLKQTVERSRRELSEKSDHIQAMQGTAANEKSATDILNLNADANAINRSLAELSAKLQSLPETIDMQFTKRMGELKQEIVQEMSAQFAVMMEGMKTSLLDGMRKQIPDDEEKHTQDMVSKESDGATARKRHMDSSSSSSSNSVMPNSDLSHDSHGSNTRQWNGHF